MLSATHIQKFYDNQDHSRLIDSLAQNGAALPLALQARLTQHTAAIGLGLRRLSELIYGPTSLSRDMAHDLLEAQAPTGAFPGLAEQDPLTTAAAASGIASTLGEYPDSVDPDDPMAEALDHALHALVGMQGPDGLFIHSDDRTEQDRALTSAFILFLLARLPRFRELTRFADLMTWFEEHADRLEPDTAELFQMARLDDPARQPESPALIAIAA